MFLARKVKIASPTPDLPAGAISANRSDIYIEPESRLRFYDNTHFLGNSADVGGKRCDMSCTTVSAQRRM